jgi:hypothetical protein
MLTTLMLAAALSFGPPLGTHCTTDEEKTMQRWQTVCDDGTRAVQTWNRTLSRWESTVIRPSRKGGRR